MDKCEKRHARRVAAQRTWAHTDGLETVATNGLMALDRSHVIFVGNLAGTVLTLTIAALLVPTWGIVGAAWGSFLGRCVTSALLWARFWK